MMNQQQGHCFSAPAPPEDAVPLHKQQLGRIPRGFKEAMNHISSKLAENTNRTPESTDKAHTRQEQSSEKRWKSSFKPIGGEDEENPQDKSTSGSGSADLYNPYDAVLTDSEDDMPQQQHHHHQNEDLTEHSNKGRWDSMYKKRQAKLPDGIDPESRAAGTPNRLNHSSSTQDFPASYRGERMNGEERMMAPEYEREMTTTVRLSPPRLRRGYDEDLQFMGTDLDEMTEFTDVTLNGRKRIIMDEVPISCDLCDVQLANSQELKEHLDSKCHWDTLEHIQQHNNYDDMAIAFIQEVMLYKSCQCSRAIEERALQALQENDHMTKIEIFHCAACKVLVSSSASAVQAHITSQEHLSNTKEFEMQQRHVCLDKAETMMDELRPQFEEFQKGLSPFE